MRNHYLYYFKPGSLITLITILASALILAKYHWGFSITTSGMVSMGLVVISKRAWNCKPFKWLFWVDDFSGRYEGILKFQYMDENGMLQSGQRKHVKIINQNGCRISVISFTLLENGEKSSLSYSKGMYVERTVDEKHFQLTYHYLNDGNPNLGFDTHFGTDVLKFIKNGNQKYLTGHYYTNRNPPTRGEYKNLKWVSNNQCHEF